jgi:hypothetical protein
MKLKVILFLLVLTTSGFVYAANSSIQLPFYSEDLSLNFNPEMILNTKIPVEEGAMVAYYQDMEQVDYQTLLDDLQQKKQHLELNDWLYYELLRKVIAKIYKNHPSVNQELTTWFLLSKAGYDTRLTYRKKKTYVYVYTQDEVFEVPLIKEGDRTYVNLTSIHNKNAVQEALYMLNFVPNPEGGSLSFYLKNLPKLSPQMKTRELKFFFDKATYQMKVKFDQTVIDLMSQYPFFAEKEYLEVPLSPTVARSLLPQLRDLIKDKTEKEALEFLVAFTRSSFKYKEDKEYFGVSKPMIADEVFYYPFSDCEDRSALFYSLVKELLQLPMVIVAFEDHLTIAVAIPQFEGKSIRFKGNDYYICDPTGPINSTVVGEFPSGYKNKPFEIIGFYQ